MEMMPYRPALDDANVPDPRLLPLPSFEPRPTPQVVSTGLQAGLPVLTGARLTLRELPHEDAASLCTLLTTEEVARFISPPPPKVAGFERFIAWAQRRRAEWPVCVLCGGAARHGHGGGVVLDPPAGGGRGDR